jgi:hypothetical protein
VNIKQVVSCAVDGMGGRQNHFPNPESTVYRCSPGNKRYDSQWTLNLNRFGKTTLRHHKLLDTLLLLLIAIALVGPIFNISYLDQWASIESTFIADARILADHMPHPSWQPLWYCGTRFDYIYPPALRYGTAIISLIGHTSTARAYHLYVGLLYVFGLLSTYWLVLPDLCAPAACGMRAEA